MSFATNFILGICGLVFVISSCQNTSTQTKQPEENVLPKDEPTSVVTAAALTQTAKKLRVTIGPNSSVRYLVREQLANRNLPNDAVGVSKNISGFLSLNADGSIDTESVISIDMSTFESDLPRRDRYLETEPLETDEYPKAQYQIRNVKDLEWPLTGNKNISFQIIGDMTLHGKTQPLKWNVIASYVNGKMTGIAKSKFTFNDFNLDIPNLFFILDVDNEIRLELVFDATVASNR